MTRLRRIGFVEDNHRDEDRQTASLAALAFALFLVVLGLFLVRALHQKSDVENCLLAGRSNCDMIVATVPRYR